MEKSGKILLNYLFSISMNDVQLRAEKIKKLTNLF